MWKVLASHYPLRDRWISVRADRCEDESGNQIEPYYTLEYPDFIHVLAVTERDEIVLVRQYRHGAGIPVLELPGGMANSGETSPIVSGLRELREETGFTTQDALLAGSFFLDPAKLRNNLHLVVANCVFRTAEPESLPGEKIDIVLLSAADLARNIISRQFLNAAHVGLIFYAMSAGHIKQSVSRNFFAAMRANTLSSDD